MADLAPIDPRGVSADQLLSLAGSYGLGAEPAVVRISDLVRSGRPAILHVNGNHFVSVLGVEDGKLVIFDSRHGLLRCSPDRFEEGYMWQGLAIVFGRRPWHQRQLEWPTCLRIPAVGALVGVVIWVAVRQACRDREGDREGGVGGQGASGGTAEAPG